MVVMACRLLDGLSMKAAAIQPFEALQAHQLATATGGGAEGPLFVLIKGPKDPLKKLVEAGPKNLKTAAKFVAKASAILKSEAETLGGEMADLLGEAGKHVDRLAYRIKTQRKGL